MTRTLLCTVVTGMTSILAHLPSSVALAPKCSWTNCWTCKLCSRSRAASRSRFRVAKFWP